MQTIVVRLALCLGTVALLMLAQEASSTWAADFTVVSTADVGHVDCIGPCNPANDPGGSCISVNVAQLPGMPFWPDNTGGPCTLRAAITALNYLSAHGSPGPHSITLPAGTYGIASSHPGSGSLRLSGAASVAVTIIGAGASSTVVDGGGNPGELGTGGPSLTINSVTVRNFAPGSLFALDNATSMALNGVVVSGNTGGGIFSSGTLSLNNVTVSGNSLTGTTAAGININNGSLTGNNVTITNNTQIGSSVGGLNTAAGVPVTLSNSTISNNSTTAGPAGGMRLADATLSLTNVSITGNSAAANGGPGGTDAAGGLYLAGGPNAANTITLTNVQITNNQLTGTQSANEAAGLVIHSSTGGTVTMNGGRVEGNSGGAVGGISLWSSGAPTVALNGVSVRNNIGGITAGGVALSSNAVLTITDSTIAGNSTTNSGDTGAGGVSVSGGQLTLNRTTVSGNTGRGVAIRTIPAQLTNVTISGNTAGGLRQTSSFVTPSTLTNLTIANNGSGPGLSTDSSTPLLQVKSTLLANHPGGNCTGSFASQGSNLSSDATCAARLTAAGDLNSTTPLLGPLADNGGAVQTHALLAGSPGINGVVSGCPPPSTDARGTTRPQGSACDIGAYEAPTTPSCTAPRPNVMTATGIGSGSLTVTIQAQSSPNAPGNSLSQLNFQSFAGGVVDLPGGQQGLATPGPVSLPAGTTTTQFNVRRNPGAQAATISLTVTDNCGSWATFVGGGASAFQAAGGDVPDLVPTPVAAPPLTAPVGTTAAPTAGSSASVEARPRTVAGSGANAAPAAPAVAAAVNNPAPSSRLGAPPPAAPAAVAPAAPAVGPALAAPHPAGAPRSGPPAAPAIGPPPALLPSALLLPLAPPAPGLVPAPEASLASVPVIPEADSLALLALGLAAYLGIGWARRGRCG